MQTFLPYSSFARSAQVLDYRRLGKERVEAWQIYQTLIGVSSGWSNHPAVKMWRGYENALLEYYNTMLFQWAERGYINKKLQPIAIKGAIKLPHWLGDKSLHLSHQSNLIRKLPEHYKQYFPTVSDDLPYVWPV